MADILAVEISATRDFAAGKRVKAFFGIERSARLKLDRLEADTAPRDFAQRGRNEIGV
jgi:hypothetical protein